MKVGSVSSYCRTFGSERAESIEKRSNFAGAGRKRDGLSRVGQAERKRNGFSFFGLWRFFKGRGIGGGFSFQDELSGGEDGDKVYNEPRISDKKAVASKLTGG